KIIAGVDGYDSGNVSKIKNLKVGYLTQQMTLDTDHTVWEEMSKPFAYLKQMEQEMQAETNWLANHADEYESETFKDHMARYEALSNQFE
ncbi:hypothetical protein NL504_27260, partial [Klebsiella pneumoniae]|nr:hypothetical protein [Klebsiella pneumoniae]